MWGRLKKVRLNFIAALILSIIVASFAIVNSKIVTINLLFTKVSVSQALVIFISVAIGAIIALLFGLVKEIKLKKELKEKKKETKNLQKEKKNLEAEVEQLESTSNSSDSLKQQNKLGEKEKPVEHKEENEWMD